MAQDKNRDAERTMDEDLIDKAEDDEEFEDLDEDLDDESDLEDEEEDLDRR